MPGWVIDLRVSREPVWVFAYGSLMWNPEMRFAERLPARIHGYHRAFCLYSPEYRGTREKPGPGARSRPRRARAAASPIAFPRRRSPPRSTCLWTREMTGFVYHLTPLTDRDRARAGLRLRLHRAPRLARLCRPPRASTRRRAIIATSKGDRGTGRDYLANTVRHLEELGIADTALHRIERLVNALG